jgi:ribonuclease G
MTRQNVTDGVREILTRTCPTCEGEGVVPSEETMAIEVLRHLRELAAEQKQPEAFLIRVNPRVAAELVGDDSGLAALEEETGKHFHFEGGEALAINTYDVVDSGSRKDIEERALPFQVGEEVLVTIEEPHMYNADDAVARVDSYIVSVSGGGDHVGERRLVRIESVARSAATASLLDANGDPAARNGEGEQVESPSGRRRGRRSGRRRSRARTAEGSGNSD